MNSEIRFSNDPVQDLLNAVVVQAADDFRNAWMTLLDEESRKAEEMLTETEAFFHSPDFECFTTANGPKIFSMLLRERQDTEPKIRKLQQARKALMVKWKMFRDAGAGDPERLKELKGMADQVVGLVAALPEFASRKFCLRGRERQAVARIFEMEHKPAAKRSCRKGGHS